MLRVRGIQCVASRFVLGLGLLAGLATVPAVAAPIVPGTTDLPARAIQDIKLLANTPFNPTNADIVFDDLFGVGTIYLHRELQAGSSIPFSLSGGQFYGSSPLLGDFVFGNIPPLTGADFSGSIENVVQDPGDPGFGSGAASSFLSGDFSFGGASFGFLFLSGPAAGISLFTDPGVPFSFSAVFDGLPPSPGTILQNSGPDVLDVLFNGILVAQSYDRRILIEAVPEPGSLSLAVLGLASFGGMAWRKRREKR